MIEVLRKNYPKFFGKNTKISQFIPNLNRIFSD